MRIKIIIALLLLSSAGWVNAQSQVPLYKMGKVVPQANLLNPGLIPDYKVVVGLPVLSSSYISTNLDNLSYNNIFDVSDNTIRLDTVNVFDNLESSNRIELDADVSILYVGLMLGKNYLALSVNGRADGNASLSKDLVELAYYGNANEKTIGRTYDLSDNWLRAQTWNEIGITYAREFGNLSVGGRINLLKGINAIDLQGPESAITADIDSISIRTQPFRVSTSGFDQMDRTAVQYISGGSNAGTSFSVGADYRINEKMSVSAAVNDLGFITWKEDTYELRFDQVDYTFSGFDLFDILEEEDTNTNLIKNELDSLQALYDPTEVRGESFRTALTSRAFLGYNYQITDMHGFGLILQSDIIRGEIDPAVSLNYHLTVKRILNLVLNASYRNNSFNNFGAGLALNLGPVQLYGMTESVNSIFQPADARRVDIRFGLNLAFKGK